MTTRARYGRCAADVEPWTVHCGHHQPGRSTAEGALAWSFLEGHPKIPRR